MINQNLEDYCKDNGNLISSDSPIDEDKLFSSFSPYASEVVLSQESNSQTNMNVFVLRDTGGNQTFITKQVCELLDISQNNPTEYVILQNFDGSQKCTNH